MVTLVDIKPRQISTGKTHKTDILYTKQGSLNQIKIWGGSRLHDTYLLIWFDWINISTTKTALLFTAVYQKQIGQKQSQKQIWFCERDFLMGEHKILIKTDLY